MPTTWPALLTSGPPEAPGWVGAVLGGGVGLEGVVERLRVGAVVVAGGDRLAGGLDDTGGDDRSPADAAGVAEGHDRAADGHLGRVAERDGGQARGALQLEDGDVLGGVRADDRRLIAPPVADRGDGDL